MTIMNLDAACAELGAKLGHTGEEPKATENSITKALGVLEEQGVYAMFLYLHAREKGWGSVTLATFLRQRPSAEAPLLGTNTKNEPFDALQELSQNLDNLLFARDLLHRALIYGRYHAKAAQKNSGNESKGT